MRLLAKEEKLRSELRVQITLLMGQPGIFATYQEELRGDADLAALELAHPNVSVKSLKRLRKAMSDSVRARRDPSGRGAHGRGKGGKNSAKSRQRKEKRCYWCNEVGHLWTVCPGRGKKKFNPKGKFASWRGALPKGVVEP